MREAIRSCILTLAVAAALPSAAATQTAAPALRVAPYVLPPYVMMIGGRLTGFSIDLWNAVAARKQVRTDYVAMPNVGALLAAIRDNAADVGVSGVFITAERDRDLDFSVSVLNAGMQVMVREAGAAGARGALADLLDLLFSKTTVVWLSIALLFAAIAAHLMGLLERRCRGGIIPTSRYIPGVFHAMYWAATALLTQAEQPPRRPLARVAGVLWMFVGIVFVALYTAQLTASLTVRQIRGIINGPEDLPGKTVATLEGSTSDDYLRQHDVLVRDFRTPGEMFGAPIGNDVDAVLFSAPTLHYYAMRDGAGKVKLVGPEFGKLDIGFAVPVNSPYRRQIDAALLGLRDDGTYERIHNEWFGRD